MTKQQRKKKSKCCNSNFVVSGGQGFPLRVICNKCGKSCKLATAKGD